jgi:hypothetical protein
VFAVFLNAKYVTYCNLLPSYIFFFILVFQECLSRYYAQGEDLKNRLDCRYAVMNYLYQLTQL